MASPGSAGCLRKYACCGQGESFAGCREVCKKCGQDWGTPPRACFIKDHNLVYLEKGGSGKEADDDNVRSRR